MGEGKELMLNHMNLKLNPHLIFSQGKFLKFFDYRTLRAKARITILIFASLGRGWSWEA